MPTVLNDCATRPRTRSGSTPTGSVNTVEATSSVLHAVLPVHVPVIDAEVLRIYREDARALAFALDRRHSVHQSRITEISQRHHGLCEVGSS